MAIWSRIKPRLDEIHKQASLNAGGNSTDSEKMEEEIWKLLPRVATTLARYAEVAARFDNGKNSYSTLRQLALQKLACQLTSPNRWHLSEDAWKISQELQQLWPIWKAGLLREFRWSFKGDLTPEQIANKMTLIRDNILSEFGLRTVHVLTKHKKRSPEKKRQKKEQTDDYTEWHVHGYMWPMEWQRMTPDRFKCVFEHMKLDLRGGKKRGAYRYGLRETWWRNKILDLPRNAAYMAENYDAANTYRRARMQEYQGANLPIPPDAGHNVRFYAAPLTAWRNLPMAKVKDDPRRTDRRTCSFRRSRKENPDFVYWQSWRGTQQVTPFAQALRRATAQVAREECIWPEETNRSFTTDDRREIYRRACQMVEDLPRIPTVRGRDGYVYRVRPGNAFWWETQFFYLDRLETPEDYRCQGLAVPDKFEPLSYDVTLHQLFRLGQAEVAPYATTPKFRPVSPLTGRPPKPDSTTVDVVGYLQLHVVADAQAEAKWRSRTTRRTTPRT